MIINFNALILTQLLLISFLTGTGCSQTIQDKSNSKNGKTSQSFIDTSNHKTGDVFKILIIGNSLTYHGIAESIGWTHKGGMAATKKENDFAHLVFKKVDSLLVQRQIVMRVANFASFEKNFPKFKFASIDSFISFNPDLIIFQLGENVSLSDVNTPSLFEKKYIELISLFQNKREPIVICTLPFWGSQEKKEIIRRVASITNSQLVDLSYLTSLNKENYAKNEVGYSGNRESWKIKEIGIHPGDLGMRNIANLIFTAVESALKSK